jgi:hypothetical protein
MTTHGLLCVSNKQFHMLYQKSVPEASTKMLLGNSIFKPY